MKKRILCWTLAVMLALPVSALAADDEQTELSGDQRKATIMVLSITGNEMTYVEIDSGQEDESEPDSEGMRELESEEMPEPESGADNEAPGGPGGGGGMPQMGNMEDMIEAFQENGGDMSQMEDMIESFQGNGGPGGGGPGADDGGQMPEGGPGADDGGQMPEGGPGADDEGQMPEDGGQPADDGQGEEGGENGGPGGGGGMPQMGNMEDMIEAFQENGGDMSQMQDMIEAFQGNGGGQMPGGAENGDQAENGEEFAGPMSGATTVYLQVGLVVHADGKDKTFSILEAGDELEVLFETDDEGNEVITEMWLLDN